MSESRVLPLSDDYRGPIRVAITQQIGVALLCLLLLDGGQLAQLCGMVMLGFWSGVAVIMLRRPLQPTPADKQLIKFAFVPLFVAAVGIALRM